MVSMTSVHARASGTADAERKRLRACAYVKRSYEKKKSTLATLRDEAAALEHQYNALIDATTAAASSDLSDYPPATSVHSRYTALARCKQQLCTEQTALRAMATAHMIHEARLQQVVDMYDDRPLPRAALTPPATLPFRFCTLSPVAWQREITISRTLVTPPAWSTPRPAASHLEVFGWRDQRQVDGNVLAFSFEKRFPHATPQELAVRTWALVADPATHRAVYSASMNAQVRVLEHVDADSFLVYWRLEPDAVPLTLKCLFLVSRFATPSGGVAIVCRTIDRHILGFEEHDQGDDDDDDDLDEHTLTTQALCVDSRSGRADRTTYWAIVDNTIVVEPDVQGGARYHFRGTSMARVWTVEILLMCMRFEHLALGTRMLPPSS